jgi:hypothetical protein
VLPFEEVMVAVVPFTWNDEARTGWRPLTTTDVAPAVEVVFVAINEPLLFDQAKATLFPAPGAPPMNPRSPAELATDPVVKPRLMSGSSTVMFETSTVTVVPWTSKSPGTTTFPALDPRFRVAAEDARLNVEAVVVISPPFTARSPEIVKELDPVAKVRPDVAAKAPSALNCTCVFDPAGVPPPPPPAE